MCLKLIFSYHRILRLTFPYLIPCHTLPYHTIPYHTLPYLTLAYLTLHYLALFFILTGCFLRMLSRGGIHVVNSGDTIRLSCEFYMENFNLFDNPVLWRKVQHQEEMQVNMMGNILEPFESVRRFKVTFVPEPSKYVLGLHITCKFRCTQVQVLINAE